MHIRKLVSGRYQCIIRLQGVSTSKTFQDKQSAKIWGQEQELSIVKGTTPMATPKDLVLSDLISRYILELTPLLKDSIGVIRQLNRISKRFPNLVNKKINDLKIVDFQKFKEERYLDALKNHNSKNGYRATNKDLTLLSTIYNSAINLWELPLINPLEKISKFPISKGIYRPIRAKEHKYLLRAANIQQKAIILLARHTGMRPKEIFSIKWNDLFDGKIYIRPEISKNYYGRIIDLNKYLNNWLNKNLTKECENVINISRTSFRFWFYRLVKKNLFKDLTIYHYRRNFVQHLIDKGESIPYVANQTGHSSWSMVQRYYGVDSIRRKKDI